MTTMTTIAMQQDRSVARFVIYVNLLRVVLPKYHKIGVNRTGIRPFAMVRAAGLVLRSKSQR